jgi:hypothetical protein
MKAAHPAWNSADPVSTWLAIGQANRWIRRACDPPFTRASFVACGDGAELKGRLAHGNWCLGQAFCLSNLCFIQQVGGGDEWLVIKENVAFESVSAGTMIEQGTFDDFLARIAGASLYACAKLIY